VMRLIEESRTPLILWLNTTKTWPSLLANGAHPNSKCSLFLPDGCSLNSKIIYLRRKHYEMDAILPAHHVKSYLRRRNRFN
jgi:hypothetical protein